MMKKYRNYVSYRSELFEAREALEFWRYAYVQYRRSGNENKDRLNTIIKLINNAKENIANLERIVY